jgi:hypothetical protein
MHNNLRRLISAYLAGEPGAHPTTATELLTRAFAALGGPVDESRDPRKLPSEVAAIAETLINLADTGRRVATCVDGSCSLESPQRSVSSPLSSTGSETTPDGSKTE